MCKLMDSDTDRLLEFKGIVGDEVFYTKVRMTHDGTPDHAGVPDPRRWPHE